MTPLRIPRAERLLNLAALLTDSRGPVPRDAIVLRVAGYREARPAVARARLRRDLAVLRAQGLPVGEDPRGLRLRPAAGEPAVVALAPPERLLLRALASRGRGKGPLSEAVASAARKLACADRFEETEGGDAGGALLPGEGPPEVPRAVPALLDALSEGREARFVYRAAGAGRSRRRAVPWGIAGHGGAWYVVAKDLRAGEPRTFRADRILGAVRLGAVAGPDDRPPPGFRIGDRVGLRAFALGGGGPVEATVRLSPDVAHLFAENLRPGDRVEVAADGSALWRAQVRRPDAFARFLLKFHRHVRVEGPPAVREAIVAEARALAALYGAGGRPA
ncbi:MAG: WYL domain-containing protein [Planctomycetales bacterium]|nr:WYL domain-containing protein [Planctomycetales bacterium]